MNSDFIFSEYLHRRNLESASPAEIEQIYYVLNDTFNPRGIAWAAPWLVMVGTAGRRSARMFRVPPGLEPHQVEAARRYDVWQRRKACLVGALYANELSWYFRDPLPTKHFCDNFAANSIGTGDGSMLGSSHHRLKPAHERVGRSQPFWSEAVYWFVETLSLSHTLQSVWDYAEGEGSSGHHHCCGGKRGVFFFFPFKCTPWLDLATTIAVVVKRGGLFCFV
jgi:hypothetical protein